MKPISTLSREDRNERPISPSFRSGPRQRPSDASTDEIVRFVREYQMRPITYQPKQSLSAMKTKAVLPGIARKQINLDEGGNRPPLNNDNYRTVDDNPDERRRDSFRGHSKEAQLHAIDGPDFKSDNLFENVKDYSTRSNSIDKSSISISRDFNKDKTNSRTHGYEIDKDYQRSYYGTKRGRSMLDSNNDMMNVPSNKNQNRAIRSKTMRQLPPIKTTIDDHQTLPRPSAPSPNRDSPSFSISPEREPYREDDGDDDIECDDILEEDNTNVENEDDTKFEEQNVNKSDKSNNCGKRHSMDVGIGEIGDYQALDFEKNDKNNVHENPYIAGVEVEVVGADRDDNEDGGVEDDNGVDDDNERDDNEGDYDCTDDCDYNLEERNAGEKVERGEDDEDEEEMNGYGCDNDVYNYNDIQSESDQSSC